ncbi:MAG: hypothetical protein C0501_17700 [Isosphaera sp.]|nr:hypothetical protein [Isosphaera sp.]
MLRSAWAAALVGPAVLLAHPAPTAGDDKGPDRVGRLIFEGGTGTRVRLRSADDKPPTRVGRVIIEGNTVVPDDLICAMTGHRPGQILDFKELPAAPARIARLGVFDPADPPTVEVVPNEFDPVLVDVRVRVREKVPADQPRDLLVRARIAYEAILIAEECERLSARLADALNPWPRTRPAWGR